MRQRISLAILGGTTLIIGGIGVWQPAIAQNIGGKIAAVVTCSSSSACVGWQNNGTGPAIQGTAKSTDAIKGFTSGTGKSGVYGETDSAGGGYGVHGANSSANGSAIYGLGRAGIGVSATSSGKQAVLATSTAGGTYDAITASIGGAGFGVRGSGGDGAEGGLGGFATTGDGVFAQSTSGVGLYAISSNGPGAQAISSNLDGLNVYSYGSGGNGDTAAGAEIDSFGTSNEQYHADGLHVYSQTGNGAVISAGTYNSTGILNFTSDLGSKAGAIIGGQAIGVIATTGNGVNSTPLEAGAVNSNGTGTGFFYVDGSGNIHYTGSLIAYARTRAGGNVSAYATKTTRSEIEDSGTAQLIRGVANVPLDSAYAQAIDLSVPYRVFLTPDGDTRGLYVARKTAQGFVVRETQGGTATLSFDYRILAGASGRSADQMSVVTPALQSKFFPMLNSHGAHKAMMLAGAFPALKRGDPNYRAPAHAP